MVTSAANQLKMALVRNELHWSASSSDKVHKVMWM
jgi:hypothetical protein